MNLHQPIHLSRPTKVGLAFLATAMCAVPLIDPIGRELSPGFMVPFAERLGIDGKGPLGFAALIGFMLALTTLLWQAWAWLMAVPRMAKRAAEVPRGAKLAAAVMVMLGAFGVPVALVAEIVIHEDPVDRPSVTHAIAQRLAPAWPELLAEVQGGLPPQAPPALSGAPDATLKALLAHRYVWSAFYLRPDGQLWIRTRPKPNQDVVTSSFNLYEWQNARRGQVAPGWTRHTAGPREPGAGLRLMIGEALLRQGLETGGSKRVGFEPLPHTLWGLQSFISDSARGQIGYVVNTPQLEAALQARLKAHGVTTTMLTAFNLNPDRTQTRFAPPGPVPPTLTHFRLLPTDLLVDDFAAQTSIRQALLAFLATSVGCFGVAITFVQFRAFLDDRVMALAQSDFVSAVSHEMRTPLTTIKLYAELIEQDVVTDPDRRRTYMGVIAKECDRLSRLVDNVLDYSALSRDRRAYHFEPVPVADLIADARQAMQAPLAKAGLAVEVDVPDGLTAMVDRDAMVQVIINLLSNAAKYADSGGRVMVAGRAEGSAVTLTVRDFGPGIPRSEQKKVFQPFYRVGDELTRTAPGTGLGLALVKAHAEAHGGRVELESAPGQGTMFRLVWPVERQSA